MSLNFPAEARSNEICSFPLCVCRFRVQSFMEENNPLLEQRKTKLASLRSKGVNPFANKFRPTEKCAEARANYTEGREVALAGRITAHRDMGKSMFIDIKDQSGRIQVYAQKNVLGDELFDHFRHLDLGDFIGAQGTLFITKTGEVTVRLTSFTILAKALRPPPEKWHGLVETEIRYRQRYLDLIANDVVKPFYPAQPNHFRSQKFPSRTRLPGSRNSYDAGHPGRRGGPALRYSPQRTRVQFLSSHCAGVVSQAPPRWRLR
jgi:hypothetical protein